MAERYHNTRARRGQTIRRRALSVYSTAFQDLVDTAKVLQGPGGCAWDRAQTINSLLPCLVEETWEVFEVIRHRRYHALREELGDVLYTVLFLTLIAERMGYCTLQELLIATRQKMVRRHPHVFGNAKAATPNAAYRQWQAIKQRENAGNPSPSKAFRKRLVLWWEWLRTHPNTGRKSPPRLLRVHPRTPVGSRRGRRITR